MNALLRWALRWYLRGVWWLAWLRLRAYAAAPDRTQWRTLQRILRDNAKGTFGTQHGFHAIESYEQFVTRVPLAEYEDLRAAISAQQGGEQALTVNAPIAYLRTSGTTSLPKDIPLTAAHLRALCRLQRLSVARQVTLVPQALNGTILALNSPAQEGLLANGLPYGAASGVIADATPRLVRALFLIPDSVLAIKDSLVKYLLILRLTLARVDLSFIVTANPSTLLTLFRLYREHRTNLLHDVAHGEFSWAERVPAAAWRDVQSLLFADPARAAALGANDAPSAWWPALRLVVTWTGGSAGIAVQALRQEIGPQVEVLELGYIASEFRGTVTLDRDAGSGFPTLSTHFFEFVPRRAWDAGSRQCLRLGELREGEEYYVIVTTPSGLFRYFINDVVRVTGFIARTPLLQFVQKGRGVTSITGEKLYEAQVISAVNQVLEESGVVSIYFLLLADDVSGYYRFYIESRAFLDVSLLAAKVDTHLRKINMEYDAKRESGRLPLMLGRLLREGTMEQFRQDCVARGQREAQFKPPALAYTRDLSFDFEQHSL